MGWAFFLRVRYLRQQSREHCMLQYFSVRSHSHGEAVVYFHTFPYGSVSIRSRSEVVAIFVLLPTSPYLKIEPPQASMVSVIIYRRQCTEIQKMAERKKFAVEYINKNT
jgi:hypothetical protein